MAQQRRQFGFKRTRCDCDHCKIPCRYMPGFLVPPDLQRLIPADADPFIWAETNLLASPGATLLVNGQLARQPTLVPARKPDGSCIHLREGRCLIHENAPYGCAFSDWHMSREAGQARSLAGLKCIAEHWTNGLYGRIWRHLDGLGLTAPGPAESRSKMLQDEGLL